MVAFLHHDVGDSRLIVFLQLDARISDGQELVVENLHTRVLFISTRVLEIFTYIVVKPNQTMKKLNYNHAVLPAATVPQELHLCRK